jgi:hypothetical protein
MNNDATHHPDARHARQAARIATSEGISFLGKAMIQPVTRDGSHVEELSDDQVNRYRALAGLGALPTT